MKTVLHIAPTPFFSDRGCHIRILGEMRALARSYRTLLCTYPLGDDVPGFEIRRPWRIPGYNQRQAGFSPYRPLADALLFLLALRVAWREKPCILHGHLHEGALIAWLVRVCLFWRRTPVIMDMQGGLTGELMGYGSLAPGGALYRILRAIERLIYRLPARVLCSSGQALSVLRDEFGGKKLLAELLCDVVPDAFFEERPEDRVSLRRELGLPPDKRLLVYAGSLLPGKGMAHLFEALLHLKEKEDVFFLLIGYPVEDVRAFLEGEGLENRAFLTGRLSYNRLARWLKAADIALDPKEAVTGEASGKLLHYMAAGLPCVCFDTANNRDMLSDSGYFASPDTPFSEAILRALSDSPEELAQRGLAGRERARRQCTGAALAERLADIYREVSGIA